MAGFSVLITGKDPGSDGAIAGALKTALNLTNDVALQIVGLTPVVLFADLTRKQAQGVSAALAPLQQAGAKMAVSNAPPGAMRGINWPKLPTVNGRPLAAYIDGTPPPPAGMQGRSPGSSAAARAAGGPTRAVQAKCPVCGAALIIAAAGTAKHAPPPPPSASGRAPKPMPSAPPPPPRPSDMSTGLTPRPGTVPAAAPPSPKPTSGGGVVVEEVGSIDDLDIGGSPPDVPEVPSAKAPPALREPVGSTGMIASATAPMDMADFEAGFLSGGEDELLSELDANLPQAGGDDLLAELDDLAGVEVAAEPVESNMPGDAPAPMPGGAGGEAVEPGDFGVFVSKGKSPKLAENLAKVMGIALDEAKTLTKKAVIPVAKGISRSAAEALKSRLADMKIRAKIRQKKR